MFCSNCGKEMEENAKFCSNCGIPIEKKDKQETIEEIKIEKDIIKDDKNETPKKFFKNMKLNKFHICCIVVLYIIAVIIAEMMIDEKTTKTNDINNSQNAVNELSEEEIILEDSKSDEIYTYIANMPLDRFNSDDGYFYKNIINMKDKHPFANKIYELINQTNIPEIYKTGTDFEQELVCAYATSFTEYIQCSKYELLHFVYDAKIDYKTEKLTQVWAKGYNEDGTKGEDSGIILKFVSNSNYETYVLVDTRNSWYIKGYRSYSDVINKYYKGEDKFSEVDEKKIQTLIRDNKDFFDIYIPYIVDIFNPRFRRENDVSIYDPNQKQKPRVGMTKSEVRNSTWGNPKRINTDTYSWGTQEQWVYDRGYVYFENGVVTTVSEN